MRFSPSALLRRMAPFSQFKLRTLFVLLTVLCVWFGYEVNRAGRQRRVLDQLANMDCVAFCAERWIPGREWLAPLIGKEYFRALKHLEINYLGTLCGADPFFVLQGEGALDQFK